MSKTADYVNHKEISCSNWVIKVGEGEEHGLSQPRLTLNE